MTLLALETTGETGSVALLNEKGLLGSVQIRHEMNLSGQILNSTRFLLDRLKLDLQAIDLFGVDTGPGSFTGLKIGVTLAKTWAHVLHKLLVSCTAFEACALNAPAKVPVLVVLPARKDAVYAQWLRREEDSIPEALSSAEMILETDLTAWLRQTLPSKKQASYVLGAGAWRYEASLRINLPNAFWLPVYQPQAEQVAQICIRKQQSGETTHPFSLVPLYIQSPSINLTGLKEIAGSV
jgi:tRNA threonylcarbamoyladenosine biosynthesis protein TsaB